MSLLSRRPFFIRKLEMLGKLAYSSLTTPLSGEPRKLQFARRDELGITFIGHSSFLLQMAGQRILVDPVFAPRLGLLRRMRRPGLVLDELPPIDVVLITHGHMDHLNKPSLKKIAHRTKKLTGAPPVVVVPWRVRDLVEKLGFSRIVELEQWWSSVQLRGVKVTLTPARHWGARLFRDTWRGYGGYMIEGSGYTVYHAGDSAYFDGFAEIGRSFRPDVALLPIGAYYPDSFRTVHTSPEEAFTAFGDVRAELMIPMHYGTFRLSFEPVDEPVPRLLAAAEKAYSRDKVTVLKEGQTELFAAKPKLLSAPPVAEPIALNGVRPGAALE